MSGAFPSSPVPSGITLKPFFGPTLVSQAQSLKEQRRTRGGQRYLATLVWPRTTKANMLPIAAFAESQQGQWDTFTIVLPPPYDTPLGTWPGSPVVDGASQTGRTLNIRGLTPSQSGIGKAGDLFKVSGHSKVYRLAADANSDGAGKSALALTQKLGQSPADGEALTVTSVPFTMRLAGDVTEEPVEPPTLFGYTLSMIEVY